MPNIRLEQAQTYRNVMESIIPEEVERQMSRLPPKVANYLNKTEVIAYALNRLPALYATSEKGWQQQRSRAQQEFGKHIVSAVRQAIAAVQRDPLRNTAPLRPEETLQAQIALQELKRLLQQEELSWHNLVDRVEQALMRTTRGEITWRKRSSVPSDRYEWQNNHYL